MFYFGSTSIQKIKNGYRGSVSSKQYKSIWEEELKNNPHLFTTKIVSTYQTREEAFAKEHKIHRLLKTHNNPLYANKSIGGPMNIGPAWNKGLKLTGVKYKTGGKKNKGKKHGPMPEKTKRKLRGPNSKKSLPGKLNGMWEKTHTDEVKARLALIPPQTFGGKTYEEIYGEERSKELKDDRSVKLKTHLKNNPGIREGKKNPNSKTYKMIEPNGTIHIIGGNLRIFCKQNLLDVGSVISCAKGRRADYKGWIINYT